MAKRNVLIVEDIRSAEKELYKKSQRWVQSIAGLLRLFCLGINLHFFHYYPVNYGIFRRKIKILTSIVAAREGIHVSETLKSYNDKFENSDVSNIQRVCVALQQFGEIVYNFVQLLDQLQLDLDQCLCESLRSFIDEELSIAINGPKLDSIKITSPTTNPKLSQSVAITQMAINKFEIESLKQFTSSFETFENFTDGMFTLPLYKESYEFAKKEAKQLENVFEDNLNTEMSLYRNYFGISIKRLLEEENRMNAQIPMGLEKALKYLYCNGLDKEGLFRISSTPDKLNFMKMKFLAINYSNEDPYLVANLVKSFFKEIPGNLIPKSSIPSFLGWYDVLKQLEKSSEPEDKDKQDEKQLAIKINADLPLSIPLENYTCLKYLVALLYELSKNAKSKMTPSTISTCISPSIFYCDPSLKNEKLLEYNLKINQIFSFIISHTPVVFPSAKRCFSSRQKSIFLQHPDSTDSSDSQSPYHSSNSQHSSSPFITESPRTLSSTVLIDKKAKEKKKEKKSKMSPLQNQGSIMEKNISNLQEQSSTPRFKSPRFFGKRGTLFESSRLSLM
ncbi:RhoGAP domain containing protein [Entamoeba histolytica HM-1:IMSS-B]|nr:RhoGAP domain containing protein [Entamoeba histolytica HM-1:IMSS-B]